MFCLRLCKRTRGNLTVECGNIYAAFIPWFLFRITHQPYSIYTYGSELIALKQTSLKNLILKRILAKAEKLFALGSYSAGILKQLEVIHPIEIVPPRITIDKKTYSPPKRQYDICTILTVGRLVRHKGHANLIHAAAQLSNEMKYSFIIVGNGPEYKTLKELCSSLGLNKSVSIKKNLSDDLLYQEFRRADFFVLPSMEIPEGTEGFGIVLLEAMAHHLPIIASASGGISEVLDNGKCGLLVEPDNVDTLAGAIRQVAGDHSFAESLAQKAYERLLTHYVWK